MNGSDLEKIVEYLKSHQLKIVTAESVTAGLIASTLASPTGCGSWLDGAFVTYSEEAKISCLNVLQETIDQYGLTSIEVAQAMAEGALKHAHANLGIATTGLAGPSSGDGDDPVGTVCFAWAYAHNGSVQTVTEKCWFPGERNEIRELATRHALHRILDHNQPTDPP